MFAFRVSPSLYYIIKLFAPVSLGFSQFQWASSLLGFWSTISEKSLSGAIIISCFLDLILMNVISSSLWRVRIVYWALVVNWEMREPYSMVSSWLMVVLMATPVLSTIMIPITPMWVLILFRVSSTFYDIFNTI